MHTLAVLDRPVIHTRLFTVAPLAFAVTLKTICTVSSASQCNEGFPLGDTELLPAMRDDFLIDVVCVLRKLESTGTLT